MVAQSSRCQEGRTSSCARASISAGAAASPLVLDGTRLPLLPALLRRNAALSAPRFSSSSLLAAATCVELLLVPHRFCNLPTQAQLPALRRLYGLPSTYCINHADRTDAFLPSLRGFGCDC